MWWLNPWREVMRLEKTCDGLNQNWCDTLALLEECVKENEYLRKVVAAQSKWSPRDPRMADPMQIKMQREAQGVKFS